MNRLSNWPRLLADYVESRRFSPFKWGENDCCLFAADGIVAITGEDLAVGVRGKYNSALSAARLMKGGYEAELERVFGAAGVQEIDTRYAQRGDVVVTDASIHGTAIGLCGGDKGVFVAKDGLVFVPMKDIRRTWRI